MDRRGKGTLTSRGMRGRPRTVLGMLHFFTQNRGSWATGGTKTGKGSEQAILILGNDDYL